MGTWGVGLFEDDVALDVQGAFEAAVEAGLTPEQAAKQVLDEMRDAAADRDAGPVVMLALASLLADAGAREHAVLRKAREILAAGAGLERWEEQGPEPLAERRGVYEVLAERLAG